MKLGQFHLLLWMLSALSRNPSRRAGGLVGALLALLTFAGSGLARDSDGLAAGRAAGSWIASRQFPNGAFFAENSSALGTGGAADTLVALVAGGEQQDAIGKGISYVVAKARGEATGPGQVSRLVMALVATGRNPRDVGGINYVDELNSFMKPSGAYDQNNVYANSVAVLGVVAAGGSVPASAIDHIRQNQCAGGGFSWQPGCLRTPDIDTTSLTIGAMIALGLPVDDPAVARARLFLLASQDRSGGFGYEAGKSVNSNSTALALSAISALKEAPRNGQWDLGEGKDPLSVLLAMQEPSGAFRYDPSRDDTSRDYATVQSIVGVMGIAYPVLSDAADTPVVGVAANNASTHPSPATQGLPSVISLVTGTSEVLESGLVPPDAGPIDYVGGRFLGLPVDSPSEPLIKVTALALFASVASAIFMLRFRKPL